PDPAVAGRKRQALGDEDDSERPLTLSTLLEALKENREEIVAKEGGDPSRIEVEYGTANLWYNSVKLASGVTSAPSGASVEKAGWVHLGNLTRQIGGSEDAVTTRWGDLRKALM
ncbi:unnamed protein product, partial [Symbiodinium necroappetens]